MKTTVHRQDLKDAVDLAMLATKERTPKQSLRCVRISAFPPTSPDAGIVVEGNDAEVYIRTSTQRAEVVQDGQSMTPALKLRSTIDSFDEETVKIDGDGEAFKVVGSSGKIKLFGMPTSEFLEPPAMKAENDYTIRASDLRRIIERTLFSVAKDSGKYTVAGLYFERDGDVLCAVALDTHRLAKASAPCKGREGGDLAPSPIVPTKSIQALLRVMGDEDDTFVEVKITQSRIRFEVAGRVLESSLVDGAFPPYRDTIPHPDATKSWITVEASRFAQVLRQASILTNEESQSVRLAASGGKLEVTSRAAEVGESDLHLPCELKGEDFEIGCRPVYMLDAMRAAGSESVTVEILASNKPIVIRSSDEFMAVVMPIQLT